MLKNIKKTSRSQLAFFQFSAVIKMLIKVSFLDNGHNLPHENKYADRLS